MSATPPRESGLPAVEHLQWGSHVCQLYTSPDELVQTLVPYFRAGLRNNEVCLWLTSPPLEAGEAKELMAEAVPNFSAYLESGQIEIRDISERDREGRRSEADGVLADWIEREERARRDGFTGLRVADSTSGHERATRDELMARQDKTDSTLGRHRILALCVYDLRNCAAQEVIDVVRTHDFALISEAGSWQVIQPANKVSERTRELEEAIHGRDEFLSLLAHELRNPLGPIRSAAHVVRLLAKSNRDLSSASDVLERQVAHMSRLVDDLLDTARIARGSFTLEREITSASALLTRALESARLQISAHRHALALTLPSEELRIDVDPGRIEQVLRNLLENAARFTPEGGRIELEAAREGNEAVLRVRDTGVGIEPEILSRIFELFPQERRAEDRSGGGLGLGLALVKRLVEMHGGRVEARSEGRGRGAEFTVRLPLTDAEAVKDAPPEPVRRPAGRSVRVGSRVPIGRSMPVGRRVLVVDDNLDACRTLRLSLELLGHQVEVAHDGVGALAAARRRRPEVVLLDIGLPGRDGYEVAKALRRLPGLADARLVALTGYGQAKDRMRGRRAGFDAFFVKPISPEALSEIVGVGTLH